jgi:uncharacterized iron-regulated protein
MRQSFLCVIFLAAALAGCASSPSPDRPLLRPAQLGAVLPADVLLLGEQHDAPEHQRIQREAVEMLASRQQLAAVVIEMAEQGTGTAGLSRDASEAAVQTALRWESEGWPWPTYGPALMAAVRAGVPVLGANLARNGMRNAMKDEALSSRLAPASWKKQQDLIRDGHCGLLPEPQLPAMARVQVARDVAMAQTVASAVRPGQVVLVLAGSGHVQRDLGIPQHLPPQLRVQAVRLLADAGSDASVPGFDAVWRTPPTPPKDYCAELREAFKAPPPK